MELKDYQSQVITDLEGFLAQVQTHKDLRKAFNEFWQDHPSLPPVMPSIGTTIELYKQTIPSVPHVCVKVPTAGGKTFIACNALYSIFNAANDDQVKMVVWLVPSTTILEQTYKNLSDKSHPYRQKIDALFQNRVEIYDKQAILNGSNFNDGTVREQLSIIIMSFDSLRSKNKEDRKMNQENGNNQSFVTNTEGWDSSLVLDGTDETASINVIRQCKPLIVVDESHNAESDLSVEMLKNLNPSFILDLTATPKRNSNIISFVNAWKLKENNMVKLPIIVYNHKSNNEVIQDAIHLRNELEVEAEAERKLTGKYIRPIVLFQAQPKTKDDNDTFDKIKKILLDLSIPEAHIKIKTANRNELKGEVLESKESEVRYIITVNALKEGWDCPNAYILAALGDKSSETDVTQILGRILRQPHVLKHSSTYLNMSYVFTASANFRKTLENIIFALNNAGYSDKDFKAIDTVVAPPIVKVDPNQLSLEALLNEAVNVPISTKNTQNTEGGGETSTMLEVKTEISVENINMDAGSTEVQNRLEQIKADATAQSEHTEETLNKIKTEGVTPVPPEMSPMINTFNMREAHQTVAKAIKIPQFFVPTPTIDIFKVEGETYFNAEQLLSDFDLSKQAINIQFDSAESELYKIDLKTDDSHTPEYVKLDGRVRTVLMSKILDPNRREQWAKNTAGWLIKQIGTMHPIADSHISAYIRRITEGFDEARFSDFQNRPYSYADKIKKAIAQMSREHTKKRFIDDLNFDKILVKPNYEFKTVINPLHAVQGLPKMLYEKESGKINDFEWKMINALAALDNIDFWTRNVERKGFCLNGFINHYPDFIVVTKSSKILLIETKGDHLDGSDSVSKLLLGNQWAMKAGNNYRYFMVFQEKNVAGTYTLDEFLQRVTNL